MDTNEFENEETIQPETIQEQDPEISVEATAVSFSPVEALPIQPKAVTPQPAKKQTRSILPIVVILLIAALLAETIFLAFQDKGVGITAADINDNGELILSYSDGTKSNLGIVTGQDGVDGADGTTTVIGDSRQDSVAINQALRSSVSIYSTFYRQGRRGTTSSYYAAGSGVIYQLNKKTGDALIVTNYHVVFDSNSRTTNGIAEQITVYLYGSEINGSEMEATYVGGSMYYDLAVLYVKGSEVLQHSDATAICLANSDDIQVGSTAIAIGNAEGDGISATSGVVSVPSEYITMTASDGVTSVDYRVMRIDTAVNSGNSGGGLFDQNGNLIGIVNAKTVDSSVENIGYALPSSVVSAVVDNIIDYCLDTDCENVMRPILGVTVQTIASNATYNDETGILSIIESVQVAEVDDTQLGKVFQTGDILVSATLNGTTKQLTRQYHLIDLLLTARVGDTIDFTVMRDDTEVTCTVTITEDCLNEY